MNTKEQDRLFRDAMACLLHAEFARSLKLFETLTQENPGNANYVYGCALSLTLLCRDEEAHECAKRLQAELGDPRGAKLLKVLRARAESAERVVSPLPKKRRSRLGWAAVVTVLFLAVIAGIPVALFFRDYERRGGELFEPAQEASLDVSVEPDAAPVVAVEPETPVGPAPKGESVSSAPVPSTMAKSAIMPALSMLTAALSTKQKEEDIKLLPPLTEGPVASVMELQPYRKESVLQNASGDSVRLINLNTRVGAWYLLETNFGKQAKVFHLEVLPQGASPGRRPTLSLYRDGLVFTTPFATKRYPLWTSAMNPAESANPSGAADDERLGSGPVLLPPLNGEQEVQSAYQPICDTCVLVRNQRPGSATEMELATDLFRTTRLGSWFVEIAKPYLIQRADTEPLSASGEASSAANQAQDARVPLSAQVNPVRASMTKLPETLGVAIDSPERLTYGQWYPVSQLPNVYVSVMNPAVIDPQILSTYTDRVDPLDTVAKGVKESESLAYLVAFDLDTVTVGYALGTDHPGVEWSERAPMISKETKGPDGFGTKDPLVTIGAVPPYYASRAIATFAGGFKRKHGACRTGEFGKIHNSCHYGFVEQGVVFSRLIPRLATVEVRRDGGVELLTWPQDTASRYPDVLHARQNGMPLIEGVDAQGISMPGLFVNQRYMGNWSGNIEGLLMTSRVGLAIQETPAKKRFLILAYFSGATPNAMARVFQAYRVQYAMQLDMNSPSLCYSALYVRDEKGEIAKTEYLHTAMATANGTRGGLRFLQSNDVRDCFYVVKK